MRISNETIRERVLRDFAQTNPGVNPLNPAMMPGIQTTIDQQIQQEAQFQSNIGQFSVPSQTFAQNFQSSFAQGGDAWVPVSYGVMQAGGAGFQSYAAQSRGQFLTPEQQAQSNLGVAPGVGMVVGGVAGAFVGQPVIGAMLGSGAGSIVQTVAGSELDRAQTTRLTSESLGASHGGSLSDASKEVQQFADALKEAHAPIQQLAQVISTFSSNAVLTPGSVRSIDSFTTALGAFAPQTAAGVTGFLHESPITAPGAYLFSVNPGGGGVPSSAGPLGAGAQFAAPNDSGGISTGDLTSLAQTALAEGNMDRYNDIMKAVSSRRTNADGLAPDSINAAANKEANENWWDRLWDNDKPNWNPRKTHADAVDRVNHPLPTQAPLPPMTSALDFSNADAMTAGGDFQAGYGSAQLNAELKRGLPSISVPASLTTGIGLEESGLEESIGLWAKARDAARPGSLAYKEDQAHIHAQREQEVGLSTDMYSARYGTKLYNYAVQEGQIGVGIAQSGVGVAQAQATGDPSSVYRALNVELDAQAQKVNKLTEELRKGGLQVDDRINKEIELATVQTQIVQTRHDQAVQYATSKADIMGNEIAGAELTNQRSVRVGGDAAFDTTIVPMLTKARDYDIQQSHNPEFNADERSGWALKGKQRQQEVYDYKESQHSFVMTPGQSTALTQAQTNVSVAETLPFLGGYNPFTAKNEEIKAYGSAISGLDEKWTKTQIADRGDPNQLAIDYQNYVDARSPLQIAQAQAERSRDTAAEMSLLTLHEGEGPATRVASSGMNARSAFLWEGRGHPHDPAQFAAARISGTFDEVLDYNTGTLHGQGQSHSLATDNPTQTLQLPSVSPVGSSSVQGFLNWAHTQTTDTHGADIVNVLTRILAVLQMGSRGSAPSQPQKSSVVSGVSTNLRQRTANPYGTG